MDGWALGLMLLTLGLLIAPSAFHCVAEGDESTGRTVGSEVQPEDQLADPAVAVAGEAVAQPDLDLRAVADADVGGGEELVPLPPRRFPTVRAAEV